MSFMSNIVIVVLAYLIDKKFGEFSFIKDPMIMINDLVNFVEKKVYKDSVSAGILFVVTVLGIMGLLSITLTLYLSYFNVYIYIIVSSFIASVFISQNALQECTYKEKDSQSFQNYTKSLQENLVAPLFYLFLFGVAGIILYKTTLIINNKNENSRCKNFSLATLQLYKFINYIPQKMIFTFVTYKCKKSALY
jgi:adenosylcobinamide-phosphate synthase